MKKKNVTKLKPVKKTKKPSKKPTKVSKGANKKKAVQVKKKKILHKVKASPKVKASLKVKTSLKVKALKSFKVKTSKLPKVKKSLKAKAKPVKKSSKLLYTAKELKHFKEVILNERKLIIQSAEANMKALVDTETGEYVGDNLTYATHMAEQGTDEMEREKNYLFVQRDEKYLGYLQEALTRIDHGTYGICIDCIDEPKYLCKTCPLIPKERLELVPITQHCIECKNLRG